jgi:RNA polymerase sigma-70 factor, ECF subfamily
MPNMEDKSARSQASLLTTLLRRMVQGDRSAAERAADLVYGELHRIASVHMKRERRDHTLQTTALVHEAYLRLAESAADVRDRAHFFAIASVQMRRILVDHARKRKAARRGGGQLKISVETLSRREVGQESRDLEVLLIDEVLHKLEEIDPRAAKVVELRFFGGCTDKETSEALAISPSAVRKDWEYAGAWLFDRLKQQTSV